MVDAEWLKYLPHSADVWRDTALVDTDVSNFDWIVITNGPQEVKLRRDPINHLWRMTRPLDAPANNARIADFLHQLQIAHVTRFVTDDPTDLDSYGLQPAHLDLWLGHGTNDITALFLGRDATKTATQVFGRREGWNVVFTTAAPPLSYWWARVNSFRDPYLLELTAPVREIQIRGPENIILTRQAADNWHIVGSNFPVDAGSVRQFLAMLTHLRASAFVKDVVTPPDFHLYGLAKPARQITLLSSVGGTNTVVAKLMFGITRTNEVFVRRADEDSVYAITRVDFNRLPQAGWEFRQRRIWNFSKSEVEEITIHQEGRTRTVIHQGLNEWSLAPSSQGIIVPPAIEETAYQLGRLRAVVWIARNLTNAAPYGFKPGNLSLTVKLKNGKSCKVDFGETVSSETALAAVILNGERWAFVCPPALYQLVQSYLTIPRTLSDMKPASALAPRSGWIVGATEENCPARPNGYHGRCLANKTARLPV